MNYCIVMPRLTEIDEQAYQFPIGIAYVASSLKNSGRNVITYNLNYKNDSITNLITRLVSDNDIDVLATGGLSAQYWQLKQIIDSARSAKPNLKIWVGGGIITSAPIPAMEALEDADVGMIGEGEITICELAEALEGKRTLESVNGLIFKRDGKWVITQPRDEIMDLDSLPYPDYEGFEFNKILDRTPTDIFALGKKRFGFLSFGRSCPFNCTFCFHPSGTKYRRRSVASVCKELDYLIDHFDIQNIYITDELFVSKKEDLLLFCEEISKRKIGFTISLRVDMVNREMLQMLKDHGCIQVTFGLESADNSILKSMNKHITVEQIEFALELCNEVGINTQGGFIFGDEAETVETYQNTVRWWKEHPQFSITTNLIIVYPGSILYQHACQKGLIKDEVQFLKDGCPIINVSKMSDQEYRDMAVEISMLRQKPTDVLEEPSIQYRGFGKIDYTARCSNCHLLNTWTALDPFRIRGNLICEHCGHTMHVVTTDGVEHCAEDNFKKIVKDHKVALWPMVNSVEEMRHAVPSIMNDNVYFIDSASLKQGGHYHNKMIYSPEIISEKQIDTVCLTVTTSVTTEILETLKHYHSVKYVFFTGDLFNPDFSLENLTL